MENITLLQAIDFIIKLAAFIGACGVIIKISMSGFTKILEKKLNPINTRLNDIELSSDKNFIVRFLADIEQGNPIDEVEKERFYEIYKRYIELGGNSYVAHKVEKLQREGKL